MRIEIFIAIVVGSIITVDAIKYRISRIRGKKLLESLNDFEEDFNDMSKVKTVPVNMGKDLTLEQIETRIPYITKILEKTSLFNDTNLEWLVEDLEEIENFYLEKGCTITDLLNEVKGVQTWKTK